jgi:hypothetical protein
MKPKKTFTRFDKTVIIFNTVFFSALGAFAMWRGEYWLLKCWFTVKVVVWVWNFVSEIYNDKSLIEP